MHDGIFVFDAVVHMLDYRREVSTHPDAESLRAQMSAFTQVTARKGPPWNPDFLAGPPDIAWANQMLFHESETDLAMAQTVPLFGLFENGVGPARLNYELAQSNPEQILFCGGVDPLYQGVKGACAELEHQVLEWGARTIKFYQAQSPTHAWAADDRRLAYPLYQKALDLGVKMIQFHKGLPLGRQSMEDLRPNDIQRAAYDFPDLNFGIHHLGDPYIDESINIAARFENVYLILPTLFNQYFVQPREMTCRLGKALFYCGDDRLCYGSDGFVWPYFQAYIDAIMNLEMPDDLQEGYGYPVIGRETREKMLGLNFARGIDLDLAPYRLAAEARAARALQGAGDLSG